MEVDQLEVVEVEKILKLTRMLQLKPVIRILKVREEILKHQVIIHQVIIKNIKVIWM